MNQVTFFDFTGTLFRLTKDGWKVCPATVDYLVQQGSSGRRIGLLCNIPPGHNEESMRLLLRVHGLEAWIEPGLFLLLGQIPCRLPEAAAFRMATALANVPAKDLLFVSADGAARAEAQKAGWQAEAPPEAAPVAGLLAATEGIEPALLAAVDPDTGPVFVLKGRVVTMNAAADVIPDGRILIRKGLIVDILKPGDPLPAEFKTAPSVDTKSTLYPGLIDLHNHLAYNILTLWKVPGKFTNRSQWQKHKSYPGNVSMPARVIAGHEPTAKAAARYIEAKALVGGCTTGQGMMMIEKKIVKYFKGLTRNVENTGDKRLPKAATSVLDLDVNNQQSVQSFRKNLISSTSFFYHLSEGTDANARQRFQDLVDSALLGAHLVGIHSLALNKNDLQALKNSGAKIVWSPFSNLLLYGQTLDLANVLQSGIPMALGCDWAPSGSKNPLLELKIAKWRIDDSGAGISAEQLVRMVTSIPAGFLGWDKYLGSLKAGAMADIVAIAGETGDPYLQLIGARERNVQLVTIHGVPRFGDSALMSALSPNAAALEKFEVDGVERTFCFKHPESLINDVTLAAAVDALREAMVDLPKFVKDTGQVKAGLLAAGLDPADEFGLVLDMDGHDGADESGLEAATLLAQIDPAKIAKSVELDPLVVDDQLFWSLLDAQANLPAALTKKLKEYYA